jgi:hypothetical protein
VSGYQIFFLGILLVCAALGVVGLLQRQPKNPVPDERDL